MASEIDDYYEILGIRPSAQARDIARAFASRSSSANDQQKVKLLEAYEFLSDPELRGEYDKQLGLGPSQMEMVELLDTVDVTPSHAYVIPEDEAPTAELTVLPIVPLTKSAGSVKFIKVVETPVSPPAKPVIAPPTVRPKTKPPEIPADAEINGELLRKIRDGMGWSLESLADRTRVSVRHLEIIGSTIWTPWTASIGRRRD